MKKINRIVVDTSIFVNPDAHHFFGQTPQKALDNFLNYLQEKKEIICYIPPSVYEELMKFIVTHPHGGKAILIHKKPPASYQTNVPALLVYEFIEEMRNRINKGLRIAEKYSRKVNKDLSEETIIKNLRDEYRVALREGIIDSKEDFDLILLAKETESYLATSDQGLIKWAHKLGIPCLTAKELKEVIV
jgi:hypothetical protein